jgi:hypothetical protein
VRNPVHRVGALFGRLHPSNRAPVAAVVVLALAFLCGYTSVGEILVGVLTGR